MTQTLLERLQREMKEKFGTIGGNNLPPDKELDAIIAHTLKEAAREIGRLKNINYRHEGWSDASQHQEGYNTGITDAQRVLIGDDN